MVDGTLEPAEKDHIMALLTGRMELDVAEAEAMLAAQVAADTALNCMGWCAISAIKPHLKTGR